MSLMAERRGNMLEIEKKIKVSMLECNDAKREVYTERFFFSKYWMAKEDNIEEDDKRIYFNCVETSNRYHEKINEKNTWAECKYKICESKERISMHVLSDCKIVKAKCLRGESIRTRDIRKFLESHID